MGGIIFDEMLVRYGSDCSKVNNTGGLFLVPPKVNPLASREFRTDTLLWQHILIIYIYRNKVTVIDLHGCD